MNNNYTLGRGKLYFSRFIEDTFTPEGYEYIGNTPELNLTIESEDLPHFSSDEGIREKDDSVPLEVNRTGSFTTDAVRPDNIGYFFFGSNSIVTVVGGDVEDEPIENVKRGRSYQLGLSDDNPIGARSVSDVTLGGNLAAKATGTLTFSGAGTANDTITIGNKTYTLKAAPAAANEVLIGASAAQTAYNLEQAINHGDGIGLLYGTDTVAHTQVTAQSVGAVVTVTAKVGGTAANAYATTESGSSTSFGAATLTGGAASTGSVAPAGNYTVDGDAGMITIEADAPDIADGDDLTVSYTVASEQREQIISGSTPVEGAMRFVAKNPKGHQFHYVFPWVKITPNGDYALKGDEWQTIPFNLEVLKRTDAEAIYVDGKKFAR